MNEQTPQKSEPASPRRFQLLLWPGLLIGLLVGQIVLMLVMVLAATNDPSFSVEPDYYQKGLNWDATAEQLRANERLGWIAQIDLAPAVDAIGRRQLQLTLATANGEPLDGAEIEVTAFPHARGSQRDTVSLAPSGSGVYEGLFKFQRKGVWEFRVAVTRGPETFTHTEKRDVYPPGEARPWQP